MLRAIQTQAHRLSIEARSILDRKTSPFLASVLGTNLNNKHLAASAKFEGEDVGTDANPFVRKNAELIKLVGIVATARAFDHMGLFRMHY